MVSTLGDSGTVHSFIRGFLGDEVCNEALICLMIDDPVLAYINTVHS